MPKKMEGSSSEYDRSRIFDILIEVLILKNQAFSQRPKLKPKLRSFVNYAFGTPLAALIVMCSASNILS